MGSRRRWLVLWLLLFIPIINFIDRQTVSVLAPLIRASLHLSNAQYGRIVAAFQFDGVLTQDFHFASLASTQAAATSSSDLFWRSTSPASRPSSLASKV